jgi:hypothetical protein
VNWCNLPSILCQYGALLYDTVIRIFHSSDDKYLIQIFHYILEEGDEEYLRLGVEDIASWLPRGLNIEGIQCSYFMRVYTI